MEPIKYAKIVYNTMVENVENNNDTKSWAYSVKILLQALGFSPCVDISRCWGHRYVSPLV